MSCHDYYCRVQSTTVYHLNQYHFLYTICPSQTTKSTCIVKLTQQCNILLITWNAARTSGSWRSLEISGMPPAPAPPAPAKTKKCYINFHEASFHKQRCVTLKMELSISSLRSINRFSFDSSNSISTLANFEKHVSVS